METSSEGSAHSREPVGQVHWAGTETATTSFGAMNGAVRSGERVCEEIPNAG